MSILLRLFTPCLKTIVFFIVVEEANFYGSIHCVYTLPSIIVPFSPEIHNYGLILELKRRQLDLISPAEPVSTSILPMAIMELLKLVAKVSKSVLARTSLEVDSESNCNSASDVKSPKPICKFPK